MRILPVLDLKGGQVVRGVAGRRKEYRPIVSRIVSSAEPLAVARAFREQFGLRELYVADLDAIAGGPPDQATLVDLLDDGFQLWVDAGVGPSGNTLKALAVMGVGAPIAGLESLQGAEELLFVLERLPRGSVVFSLDMTDGKPVARAGWTGADPWLIARQAVRLGVRRILVLDLAAVGVGQGVSTTGLCTRLREAFPYLQIVTGGGVRGPEDLRLLKGSGVNAVLVASALHDGRLSRQEIDEICRPL
ncbi:MAG TPA: HisA/HisF-related TIM barrel protein [Gemmataceae bacterium]|nr:HisA/HisF-related TIM barrel protein [Gemmataceae bacterium]